MTREGVYKLNDEKREIFGKTWGIFKDLEVSSILRLKTKPIHLTLI